ncbi:MAG: TPM domain-containing protein [Arcicella sp.]|nr:TPM domain-containing protein [Arcicella sp.]
MLSRLSILFIFCFVLFTKTNAQDIPAKPNPPRLVNDFVMKLNPNELQSLEQKLRGYADSTSTQITIVIVKNTGDSDPYDYAIKLAKDWGVGQASKNNGLVLLWATETRKLRIVTGRGMEATITDAISKRIINTILKPYFQAGQYYQGLDEATSAIIRRASGEFEAEPKDNSEDSIIPLLVIILVIMVTIFIVSKKGGGRNGGRGFNSSSGGWGGPIIFSSGGSSGWGGGSLGGDSEGGGFDFGGFGGGDFGGGGAGGDY